MIKPAGSMSEEVLFAWGSEVTHCMLKSVTGNVLRLHR